MGVFVSHMLTLPRKLLSWQSPWGQPALGLFACLSRRWDEACSGSWPLGSKHSSLSAQFTSESRASAAFSQMVLSLSRDDLALCGQQCPLMCQHHSKPRRDFCIVNTFVLALSLCTQASISFAPSFPWGL